MNFRIDRHHARRVFLAVVVSLSGAVFSGCSTTPPFQPEPDPSFYPSYPSQPRFVHLVSFQRPEDLRLSQPPLMNFLVGKAAPRLSIGKPYGLAFRNGRIYVTDPKQKTVHILDLKQRRWSYFTPGGQGSFKQCMGIDVAGDGTMYVADSERGQVLVYDANGQLMRTMAPTGGVSRPVDVSLHEGRLYVADMVDGSRGTVQVYDAAGGGWIGRLPAAGMTNKDHEVVLPCAVAVDKEGGVYVSDFARFRVQKYGSDGRFIRSIGHHGTDFGGFGRIKGVAVMRDGVIVALDAAYNIAQVFDAEGRVLMYFGEVNRVSSDRYLPGKIIMPSALRVGYDNLDLFKPFVPAGYAIDAVVLVINQMGSQPVSVYGYLRQPAPVPTPPAKASGGISEKPAVSPPGAARKGMGATVLPAGPNK